MISLLLVDDSKFSCKREKDMFVEYSDEFEVTLAFKPSEVIEMFEKDPNLKFDLAILDFNMPEMNGLELAEHISDRIPYSQIILLTATSAFATGSKQVPEGMRLIQKPLSIDKIKETFDPIAKGA